MEELRKLFTFFEHDSQPLALLNETMVKMLATKGMKRQELVDLTWEQIDFYNGTVLICGKGKKRDFSPYIP